MYLAHALGIGLRCHVSSRTLTRSPRKYSTWKDDLVPQYSHFVFHFVFIHSSEIRGLCLMKSSSYLFKFCHILYIRKPKVPFSILCYFIFPQMPSALYRHRPNSPAPFLNDWLTLTVTHFFFINGICVKCKCISF